MNDEYATAHHNRFARRKFLAGLVLGGGSLAVGSELLAACTSAAPSGSSTASRLTVAITAYENNLTPFTLTLQGLPNTHDLVNLVYDTLFWSQATVDPEPFLAESATSNADRTEWTVKLRRGVLWHDGKPFTSDDVKFSFDYYKKTPGASGRYAHHVSDVPPYDHAEIVDDTTIKLHFSAPAPTFNILPGADLPIIARHVWESVADPKKQTTQLPVGTGPFQLVEMVPDQLYRLKANANYFKGKPLVDELVLPIVRDPTAAFAALRGGQVDSVARNVPPELVDQFSSQSDLKVVRGTRWESVQLYFNCMKSPLSDARLRKAIALGIDNNTILQTVLLGHGQPGHDNFLHPSSPWALPGAQHEFDPARAQQMLDSSGFVQRGSDGVRSSGKGERLEFAILVSSFDPQGIRACQLAAQQVAPIGVKLNVTSLDPASLTQARSAPSGQVPHYDMYLSSLETHAHADPDGLYYFFHSPGPKGFGAGITGYANPKFDALSEQATTQLDLAARKELLYGMQRILAAEVPALVLYYPDGLYVYRPATYSGWISDAPQGIFTKRSFLPGYPRQQP